MNTEMQSHLFECMGSRDAHDNLYKLKPDLARQMDEEVAADFERAEERHIAPDDIFAYALNPDSPRVKEDVLSVLYSAYYGAIMWKVQIAHLSDIWKGSSSKRNIEIEELVRN